MVFRGRRYDTREKLSYLKAVLTQACESDDLGPDLRDWLRVYTAELQPANTM